MQSKKKTAKQKASKESWKTFREGILKEVGYDKLKAKHGKSKRPSIPNYKIDNPVPLSNKVTNGFKKKSAAQHEDAISFPIGNSHKQGLELIYSEKYAAQMNGKKT